MKLHDFIETGAKTKKDRVIEALFPKYFAYSKKETTDYIMAVCIQFAHSIYALFFFLGLTYIFSLKTLLIMYAIGYTTVIYLAFNPKAMKKIINLTKNKK